MADHSIDILIRARDQASKTIGNVNKQLGQMGSIANRGVRTAASNLARLGAVTAGIGVGLGVVAIKNGVQSLAELENATTSVDGAIRQMGLTGQTTSAQVAAWANQIESDVQAAFDDKDITRASGTLLRFGKVTAANLRPAMVVMTDLAVKTGSVDSAASLLGKALADPEKAAGKLARQGIILTKAEQKQIESFVKAGKAGKAQAVILQAVSRTTKDAAKNSVGPYGDALNMLNDAGEDATRLLATGFLPVIQKTAKWLNDALADPAIQANLKTFGQGLADAADSALEFAKKIPWSAIGTGLKTAADWAGKLFDAFRSLPPEVQGTIVALAGLNKLSGGAIGSIVSSLGSGLIKGVLGMTAGVVNINAGVVNGGGLPGGGGPGAPSGGGGVGGAAAAAGGTAGAAVFIPDMHQFNRDLADRLAPNDSKFAQDVSRELRKQADKTTPWDRILEAIGLKEKSPETGFGSKDKHTLGDAADTTMKSAAEITGRLRPPLADIASKQDLTTGATRDMDKNVGSGLSRVDFTTRNGTAGITSAVNFGAARTVSAIANAFTRMPTPIVNVNVGPGSITRTIIQQSRSGSVGGSRGGSNDRGK